MKKLPGARDEPAKPAFPFGRRCTSKTAPSPDIPRGEDVSLMRKQWLNAVVFFFLFSFFPPFCSFFGCCVFLFFGVRHRCFWLVGTVFFFFFPGWLAAPGPKVLANSSQKRYRSTRAAPCSRAPRDAETIWPSSRQNCGNPKIFVSLMNQRRTIITE